MSTRSRSVPWFKQPVVIVAWTLALPPTSMLEVFANEAESAAKHREKWFRTCLFYDTETRTYEVVDVPTETKEQT